MNAPRFTIAIPTYQRPQLVLRAIESALAQTYAPVEILVHDNSTDTATEEVIRGTFGERVKYLRHPSNLGIAGNWNSLIAAAKGDYIKFLNDDDLLDIECLAIAAGYLKKMTAGVVTCRARYVDESLREIKADRITGRGDSYWVEAESVATLCMRGALPVRTPTHSFYNTELAKRVGGFTTGQDYTRDVFLASRLAAVGGALFLEERPLVSFLIHPGQDGKKVAFTTRVEDQLAVKRWAWSAEMSNANKKNLRPELTHVVMRETVLMLRNFRWRDAASGFRQLLTDRYVLDALRLFVKREVTSAKYWAEFESARTYLSIGDS